MTQYELDKEVGNDYPYFWLGEQAPKITWYARHYSGIAFKCHVASIPGDFLAAEDQLEFHKLSARIAPTGKSRAL